MNSGTIALDSLLRRLVLFVAGRKAARPGPRPNRLLLGSSWEALDRLPVRRRVPIAAWQTDAWTKKILPGRIQPNGTEKVRILRLKRS